MYDKQQREVGALHSFIDRFRAKASKARQAQSRLKALARMEEIAAAHVDTPFNFRFAEPAGMSDPLLQLEQASAGYGEHRDPRTPGADPAPGRPRRPARPQRRRQVDAGEAAGRRTEAAWPASAAKAATSTIGYFAQHQVEQLRPDESPLQHLIRAEPTTREQELRDYLGGFDFRGDMVSAPCGRFSGGEKARLVLALLIRQRPNLLLLDEPTNHLDLEMREALTLALQETEAAVVVVSHDRHLLRTTCDELLAGGRWQGGAVRRRPRRLRRLAGASSAVPTVRRTRQGRATRKRAGRAPAAEAARKSAVAARRP